MLPYRLPNKKVDFRFGFVGLNVCSVLTVVFELLRLSFVFCKPTAVEFVDKIMCLAPRSSVGSWDLCLSELELFSILVCNVVLAPWASEGLACLTRFLTNWGRCSEGGA